MKRLIHTLIATALFASPAFAHDPKLHKGPKVEGKVVSMKGDRLELGAPGSSVPVYLTDETRYEQGEGGAKAARSALREGQRVVVHGRKLASGKFVASEVMIHADADGESKPHGH